MVQFKKYNLSYKNKASYNYVFKLEMQYSKLCPQIRPKYLNSIKVAIILYIEVGFLKT